MVFTLNYVTCIDKRGICLHRHRGFLVYRTTYNTIGFGTKGENICLRPYIEYIQGQQRLLIATPRRTFLSLNDCEPLPLTPCVVGKMMQIGVRVRRACVLVYLLPAILIATCLAVRVRITAVRYLIPWCQIPGTGYQVPYEDVERVISGNMTTPSSVHRISNWENNTTAPCSLPPALPPSLASKRGQKVTLWCVLHVSADRVRLRMHGAVVSVNTCTYYVRHY